MQKGFVKTAKSGLLFSLAMLFLAFPSAVLGVTVNFSDFTDTSTLSINGDATTPTTDDGVVLRVTPAQSSKAGSVFSTTPLNASDFSTFFKFRITEPGGTVFDCNTEAGADGLVFVVQAVSSDIGGQGQGIGYDGIDTSVGVEFDTWCNAANHDPSSNHLGIVTNGEVNHGTGSPLTVDVSPDFDDGNVWYAWIDYDGTTLEVRAGQSATRPSSPLLSTDIDIPAILGQTTGYVGFTSGTGLDWGNHDVILWEYRGSYNPITGGNATCYTQLDVNNAYQQGYQAGVAAAGVGECSPIGDSCPVIDPVTLSVTASCADYNGVCMTFGLTFNSATGAWTLTPGSIGSCAP